MFGLSQLYQMRGRVGRSDVAAYTYLLYPPGHQLSNEAKRRLKAMRELSHLGSGFELANRDLEIRGAGNIFGTDQVCVCRVRCFCVLLLFGRVQAYRSHRGFRAPPGQTFRSSITHNNKVVSAEKSGVGKISSIAARNGTF